MARCQREDAGSRKILSTGKILGRQSHFSMWDRTIACCSNLGSDFSRHGGSLNDRFVLWKRAWIDRVTIWIILLHCTSPISSQRQDLHMTCVPLVPAGPIKAQDRRG